MCDLLLQVILRSGKLPAMSTTVKRLRPTRSPGRMVRLSPEASRWMEKTAIKRRMNLNALVDVVIGAFKKMPADQQAKEFAGGEVEA